MASNSSLGTPEQLRDKNYMPPLMRAIPLGIQHVLAMFVSNITPAIIVAGAAGIGFGSDQGALGFPDMTYMIQMSMFFAGVATLIQTIGLGPIGGKLPIVQGTSFAYLPVMIPAVAGLGAGGLGGLMAGVVIGGIFHFILGNVYRQNPVCIATIGDRPDCIDDRFGTRQSRHSICCWRCSSYGQTRLWHFGYVDTCTCSDLRNPAFEILHSRHAFSFSSAGWYYSWIYRCLFHGPGKSQPILVRAAAFELPNPLRWGFEINWAIIIGMCLMAFISAIETVGDVSGITKGGAGREATDKEIQGATFADGLGTAIAGIFGGLPNTSFSQNVGLISMTGVMSRHVVTIGAVFLIIAGLIPTVGAVIRTIPINVLGGGVIIMFGMVAAAGVNMLSDVNWNRRNMVIFATALSVGLGLQLVPEALQHVGSTAKVLLTSGLLPAAFIAIVLNLLLPKDLDGDESLSGETSLGGLGNTGGSVGGASLATAGAGVAAAGAGAAASFVSSGTAALRPGVDFIDDVQLIDGVGNKIAKALKERNAGTLTAIASLSDEMLDQLGEVIGAKGRPRREEWKAQAVEMMSGKPPRAKIDQELVKKLLGR